jgi:hypothetical protein
MARRRQPCARPTPARPRGSSFATPGKTGVAFRCHPDFSTSPRRASPRGRPTALAARKAPRLRVERTWICRVENRNQRGPSGLGSRVHAVPRVNVSMSAQQPAVIPGRRRRAPPGPGSAAQSRNDGVCRSGVQPSLGDPSSRPWRSLTPLAPTMDARHVGTDSCPHRRNRWPKRESAGPAHSDR